MRTYPHAGIQKMMFSGNLQTVLKKPTNRHERRTLAKLRRR